jgi:hypothetical protein
MKPINTPTIPVNMAKARVKRFREQLIDQVPESNIPRAILIPIDDLMAIVEKYTVVDDDGNITNSLSGVRAYFAVKVSDMDLDDDVTALIVAVDKEGKDLINTKKGLGNPGDDDDDSEIYDFTRPCPDICDVGSPLYIP